jgi:simple sugar transport system permease protein
MAAVIGGRANVLCIAYEAMMLCAALGGVIGSALSNSLVIGMLVGILCGCIIAVLFGYFVLYLDAPPLLAGLALNTFGSGLTVYVVYLVTGMKQDTSTLKSLQFPNIDIPLLKDIPVIGKILSGQNIMIYLSFLSVLFVWFLFHKTTLGIRIRAVGTNPEAAESVGINVKKTKFIALLISGVLASFGGMYLSMGYLPYFSTGMTAGRAYISIAAQNLGQGSSVLTMLFSLIFGASMALGNIAQSFRLPSQFASMMPYIVTIIGVWIRGLQFTKHQKKVLDGTIGKSKMGVAKK